MHVMEQSGDPLKKVGAGYMLYAAQIRQLPQGWCMPSAKHLGFLSNLKTWIHNVQIHDMLMQQISVR